MDANTQLAADRVYEDFEPYFEWARDEASSTLIVMLPGYRRDQLKVQVTSTPAVKISGERQITGNRWRRFNVEFPIPSNSDTDNVSAKLEGGKLDVKFPRLIKPKEPTDPPQEEAPTPRPKEEPSQKVNNQQKGTQEGAPKAKKDKAEETRTNKNEVYDHKTTPQKEKKDEASPEKEKRKTETEASKIETVRQKVKTNGLAETAETSKSAAETKDAKIVTRSKTRLLDFTPTLGPTNQDYNAELNKRKKLVNRLLLILLVVGVGLYARNAFRSSSREGSKFQEL